MSSVNTMSLFKYLLTYTLVFSSLILVSLGITSTYITAHAGDSCRALAQRCGISQSDLTTYNPPPDFCYTGIKVNDPVCCSSGSLPGFFPKPYSNGTRYTYKNQQNDNCADIAMANEMDKTPIPGYNNQTWGWSGCGDLQAGGKMCLSDGTSPFTSPMDKSQ